MNLNVNQKLAVEKLSKLRAGALFMKMGTGKTKVAIDLVKSKINDIETVIWIAPASLIREKSYHEEIKKWGNDIYSKFRFFTIESVSASDMKYLELRNLAEKTTNFCVVDESITIKNTDAGRTKRLLEMYNLFNFRLILNGTALTQGLIDLYSQIQFLSPLILKMTERQFATNFLTFKNEYGKPWKRWSKPENEEALIEIIRPYIFDADLDIPVSMMEYDTCFELDEEEQQNYFYQKNRFLKNKVNIGFLEVAQKFQHIYTNCRGKLGYLNKLVNEILGRGEKVIIYVKFIDEIECLRNMFNCVVLTGKEKGDIEEFKSDKNILICTYGVGSFGLNLQFANNIIYFTQTFDYKDKIQSMYRIYRTGQPLDCNVFNFWVKTGLDALIKKSLEKKQNTLENVERIISAEKAMKL